MLQQWQIIRLFVALVQQILQNRGMHLDTRRRQRALDSLLQLYARHPRHKILAVVQSLRQPVKLRAFT